MFTSIEDKEQYKTDNLRNFFCYGIMKSMPIFLQGSIYNEGAYNNSSTSTSGQIVLDLYTSKGTDSTFLAEYSVLENLNNMTNITDEEENTFLMMSNATTHEPVMLKEPAYEPAEYVDNTEYEKTIVIGLHLMVKHL